MLERIQRVLVILKVALKQKLSVLRRYETPSYDVVSFKECNSAQSYGIFFFIILTSNQSQLLGSFRQSSEKNIPSSIGQGREVAIGHLHVAIPMTYATMYVKYEHTGLFSHHVLFPPFNACLQYTQTRVGDTLSITQYNHFNKSFANKAFGFYAKQQFDVGLSISLLASQLWLFEIRNWGIF